MPHDILIIDDEADIREAIQGILEDEGYTVRQAASAETGFEQVLVRLPDLVILDVWLKTGDRDGLNLLARLRKRWPSLPVLMISGHGTIEMAVSAIKQGAYDFIEKPFQADRLLLTLERALEAATLRQENRILREQMEGPSELTGTSPLVGTIRQGVEKVGPTNSRVMITGAPGTGKEVVARMIHRLSPRAAGPFITLGCALLEAGELESELFGDSHRPGVLKQADGGTLLLDEVADLPAPIQARLLRVLQEGKFQHQETGAWMNVDVRLISSTSRDIPHLIAGQNFREDLYYRLNVVPLHLPALRDRRDDIPALLDHFMTQFATLAGKAQRPLTSSALAVLQLYDWPGNVRQLKNVAEWLVIMAESGEDGRIDVDHLPPEILGRGTDASSEGLGADLMGLPLREAREHFERYYLQAQVSRFGGSVSKAAQFVGMERSALHRKLRMLGVGASGGEDHGDPAGEEAESLQQQVA